MSGTSFSNRPILIANINDSIAKRIANEVNNETKWREKNDSISLAGKGDEYLTGAEISEFRNRLINELISKYILDEKQNATVEADSIINNARYDGEGGFANAIKDVWNWVINLF